MLANVLPWPSLHSCILFRQCLMIVGLRRSRTLRRAFWATLSALLSWWLVYSLRSFDVHGSEGLVFIFTAVSLCESTSSYSESGMHLCQSISRTL